MRTTGAIRTNWDVSDEALANEDAERMLWDMEMGRDMFHASPSLVGETLYCLSDKGVLHVVSAGDTAEPIAQSKLDDPCHASPAFVDGRIVIRSRNYLWCLANTE